VLLWILMAVLTAVAVAAVLAPLGRAAPERSADAAASDVYLDQLAEIERDEAAGRLGGSEARAARAEVGRRILRSEAEKHGAPEVRGNPPWRRAAAVIASMGIPALSLGLYLLIGTPNLPGQPLAARAHEGTDHADIEALVAKVESHLMSSPDDGGGWDVIAPVYLKLGRGEDAVNAYRMAIRLLGSTGLRQEGLGQAIFAREQGIVTAEARSAFEAARAANPAAPGPRYFLGLADAQQGKAEDARRTWLALLAEAPAGAPWRPTVEQSLAGLAPAPASASGPSVSDVAAAQDMTASQRGVMIEGMVSGLAERLKRQPDDVEGWLKLVRSYAILGKPLDAGKAAYRALLALPRSEDRGRVQSLVADLGIHPQEAEQ
jgi:cytochrome c-type biogenesis protein CcmH